MIPMYPMKPATQATAAKSNRAATGGGRRIQVRRSGGHGKGVFALKDLEPGEVLIEYTGQLIDWDEALRRHPHDVHNPTHTFYFQLEDGMVIDALYGGNASRWINHACDPNCEAEEANGRVFIKALRPIHAGEELFYDYGLTLDERYTPAVKKRYACHCGAAECRGTMLSPKRPARSAQR